MIIPSADATSSYALMSLVNTLVCCPSWTSVAIRNLAAA